LTDRLLSDVIFPFSPLTLLVGRQEWHPIGCWWWLFEWSFAHLNSSICYHCLHHLAPIKSRMATLWYQLT